MIKDNKKVKNNLPKIFKPIMWSYNFDLLDLEEDKKSIIVNTINYGDLNHWRWIANYYGSDEIRKLLEKIPATELRDRARNLAGLVFNIKNFNYEKRCAHSKG